jgi:group I intron endonuclease
MENKFYIIYKVTNITNNKCYIGLTSRDFETRRYEHIYESNSNSVFKFHQALRKYSNYNFTWEILESGLESIKIANEREIYYVTYFDSYRNGYNMTKGGGYRAEFNHSDESKLKMRNSHLGKKLSDETKEKMSKTHSGKPKTKEHSLKVIESRKGYKHSDETKRLISENKKGKKIKHQSPSAIKVLIYNSNNELKYECHGNFETICKENGLPTKALRNSYYDSGKPIYSSKINNDKYQKFINWYAIKLN